MSKSSKSRTPMFRIVPREKNSVVFYICFYIAAVIIALGVGALLLMSLGVDAGVFYKEMLTIGTLDNVFAYKNVEGLFKVFIPLLITSLALSLAFRMKFWNIGGEGQFIMGAIAAAWVAVLFGDKMNPFVGLICMAVAGGIAGGLYGVITAVLKVKWGTNETLMTLMFNYIALYLLKFFGETPGEWNLFLDSESARPRFAALPEALYMPVIKIGNFSLNISMIFALLLVAFIYIYLKKTKQGYELSVVGDSASTANYAGMKVGRIIIRTIFLSACLIGVAGALHVSTSHTLSTSITNDVGWTGVIVAWLSKLNPIGILVTGLLISILQYGCQVANADFSNIDSNFADLLQGIILFMILIADFLIRYRIIWTGRKTKETAKEENA